MLAGSSAPPMESPPSSGISEVSSDEDMPPVKRIQEVYLLVHMSMFTLILISFL